MTKIHTLVVKVPLSAEVQSKDLSQIQIDIAPLTKNGLYPIPIWAKELPILQCTIANNGTKNVVVRKTSDSTYEYVHEVEEIYVVRIDVAISRGWITLEAPQLSFPVSN
jgi:hypothetical protein